jgi:glycerol-3-phosphate acyltransferase PlsY
LAVFLGHLYPFWLRFRGGKGVATALGLYTALAWPVGLISMGIWLLVARLSRYSSLSALVSLSLAPFMFLVFGYQNVAWVSIPITLFVYLKHTPNIRRLFKGTETKIGHKCQAVASEETQNDVTNSGGDNA